MLKISVVIPVYNAMRTLSGCLPALGQLAPAPGEVLLVDGGSNDGSLDYLEAFARDSRLEGVQVLQEPQRGAGAARNTGIRAAKGDVIALTDADCSPEPGWLGHLASPFEDADVGAVAGRIVPAPAGSIVELFSGLYTLRSPDRPTRQTRWTPWEGGYSTANLAVRRPLLEELGGFDVSEIYGEDQDLCARLYARGVAIAYVPEARVAHHHRTTLRGMLYQAFVYGQGHPLLLRRHAPRGLWLDLPLRSVAWPRCRIRAWVDLASADKKVMAIWLLGAVWSPLLWLLPLYAGWLAVSAGRRARRDGTRVSPVAALALGGLLFLKSAAMTAGRWWGSVRYGAICL